LLHKKYFVLDFLNFNMAGMVCNYDIVLEDDPTEYVHNYESADRTALLQSLAKNAKSKATHKATEGHVRRLRQFLLEERFPNDKFETFDKELLRSCLKNFYGTAVQVSFVLNK
jgi:hypothetical protein